MTKMKNWLIACAAFLTLAAAPAGLDTDQAAYQVQVPLTPVGAGPVQRVRLPLEVLLAAKSDVFADVRIFDGKGRVVPMARMPALPGPSRTVYSNAMPLFGGPKPDQQRKVTVKLDDNPSSRTVTVDDQAASAGTAPQVVGTLFDLTGQAGEIESVSLDATIPEGQPVTLIVEASEDLKTWRPLGETVHYRPPGGAEADIAMAVKGTLTGQTQVRVSWRSDAPLTSPVTIRQAIIAAKGTALAEAGLKQIAATPPALLDAHTLEFLLPFAAPIETIRVDAKGGEGLVPIQILGRNHMEEPWVPIGRGRAEAKSMAIDLDQRPIRMMRIEADRRVGGFSKPPALSFGLRAPEIAFVTSGQPPFTLAVGHPTAEDVYLPLNEIAKTGPSGIQEAKIRDIAIGDLTLTAVTPSTAPKQTTILWTILIGVTLLLAAIAWYLWSQRDKSPVP